MSTYWEKLRDPRWQQMRLRVMEREKFACQECGDATTTLNVHHTYYERGNDPWDYPAESLQCLCEPCHLKASERRKLLTKLLADIGSTNELMVLGFVQGLRLLLGVDKQCELYDVETLGGMVFGAMADNAEWHSFARQLEADVLYERAPVTLTRIQRSIDLKREFNAMDAAAEACDEDEESLQPDWGMAAHA